MTFRINSDVVSEEKMTIPSEKKGVIQTYLLGGDITLNEKDSEGYELDICIDINFLNGQGLGVVLSPVEARAFAKTILKLSEIEMVKPAVIAFDVENADYEVNKEFLDKADALLEKDN